MRSVFLTAATAACLTVVQSASAQAQGDPQAQIKAQMQAAFAAARKTATIGPAKIQLLDQGTLTIKPDEVFIPAAEANQIMAALGNQTSPARFGLIVPKGDNLRWMVDVDWIHDGYVRDGDAKDWQPDTMLQNLKDGTEQGNVERQARGIPPLDVTGWVEQPAYDNRAHRLVWSLALRDRGAAASEPQTINYNTYALGRDGYFSLDLITGSDTVAADKAIAKDLLGSLNYAPGKRYEDFTSSTDKVAEYGLGALIGVVAVKKLGLLGMLGIFLVKIWKLAAVAIAAGAAAVRRFFRRGGADEAAA